MNNDRTPNSNFENRPQYVPYAPHPQYAQYAQYPQYAPYPQTRQSAPPEGYSDYVQHPPFGAYPEYAPYPQYPSNRQNTQYRQYAPYPSYAQPVEYSAPEFSIKPQREPRLQKAGKDFNRLSLAALFQQISAFIFVIPLEFLALFAGVNILNDQTAYMLLQMILVPLSTALPFFIYMKVTKNKAADLLKFEKTGFFTSLLFVLAGLALCLLVNYPCNLIIEFFESFGYNRMDSGVPPEKQTMVIFLLDMLSTGIIVPVMEEFAFRGVLLSTLKKHGAGFAVIGSALVFSMLHLDLPGVIFAFVAGLVFGYIYVRTENLWITVFIHAINNLLATAENYGGMLFGDNADLFTTLSMFIPVGIGVIALIVLLIVKRKLIFSRLRQLAERPLRAGEAIGAMARSPMFWLLVLVMITFTVSEFF